jgi:hypothetical protein
MGHRADTYQEFVLTYNSPWHLGSLTNHNWSLAIYVSGTITHSAAEAESAALELASIGLALATPQTYLAKFNYYPAGSLISTVVKTYLATDHPGTRLAYVGPPFAGQQLEVAAVAHAPIGVNSRGKEVYLRHYFHDVSCDPSAPSNLATLSDPGTMLKPFNTGAGPHAVVPVSPSNGKAGTWVMEAHAFTHQLRKGKKRKTPAKTSGGGPSLQDLLNLGLTAAQAAAFLLRYFPE